MKKSKSYCKAHTRGRCVSIEEKFLLDEDPEKRVKIPEFMMRKSDLEYLNEAAKKHNMSRSCFLERMIKRAVLFDMLKNSVMLCNTKGAKRKSIAGNTVKVPKLTIHPAYIEMLNAIKESHNISYGVLFLKIFLAYRAKYPVYIRRYAPLSYQKLIHL